MNFESSQKYPNWIWWIMGFGISSSLLIIVAAGHQQLYDYFNEGPLAEDGAEVLQAIALIVGVFVGIHLLIFIHPSYVRIDSLGIHYKAFPFVPKEKSILWKQVNSVSIVNVEPLTEFGGWGYRSVPNSKKGIIMKGGPALRIESSVYKKPFYLTIDDQDKALKALGRFHKTKD